jgi:hypothetical protein
MASNRTASRTARLARGFEQSWSGTCDGVISSDVLLTDLLTGGR